MYCFLQCVKIYLKKRELIMNDVNTLRFILHVSDFHLTDDPKEIKNAQKALKALTEQLKSEKIKVDYLIHTGDVINSSDIFDIVANQIPLGSEYMTKDDEGKEKFSKEKFKENASQKEKKNFDKMVRDIVNKRFEIAENIMRSFISDLNISLGSVIICCGNHDVLRPFSNPQDSVSCVKENENWKYNSSSKSVDIFQPFEDFLNRLQVANSKSRCKKKDSVSFCTLDNLNVLILNTNWTNPRKQKEGSFCVRCDKVKEVINSLNKDTDLQGNINIILAHKPVYEICEKARLAYKRYIKTSFMSDLQKFVGDNGIYFCGDKHTRSIIGSQIHDIPHYFSGEPLTIPNEAYSEPEVEYNLLEISNDSLGMERKIHLKCGKRNKWKCEIRPQDAVVSKLYKLSQKHIVKNTFETIAGRKTISTWESLCQEIYNWNKDDFISWYTNLNNLYLSICKYRKYGSDDVTIKPKNIFNFVLNRILIQMNNATSENLLNIRGENSSGKSTFLGLLYIFLLYKYSIGEIDFIPAYFNLESDEMKKRIKSSGSYYDAVKDVFEEFAKNVQNYKK